MAISSFLVLTSLNLGVTTNGSVNEIEITIDRLLIVFMSLILLMLIVQLFIVAFAAIKAYNGEHSRYPLTIRVMQ